MSKTIQEELRYYLLVGDEENWEISIKEKIWGFTDNSKGMWNTTKKGEFLAFYVTSPVKKIIGFGKVSEKFIDDKLLWNDEKKSFNGVYGEIE